MKAGLKRRKKAATATPCSSLTTPSSHLSNEKQYAVMKANLDVLLKIDADSEYTKQCAYRLVRFGETLITERLPQSVDIPERYNHRITTSTSNNSRDQESDEESVGYDSTPNHDLRLTSRKYNSSSTTSLPFNSLLNDADDSGSNTNAGDNEHDMGFLDQCVSCTCKDNCANHCDPAGFHKCVSCKVPLSAFCFEEEETMYCKNCNGTTTVAAGNDDDVTSCIVFQEDDQKQQLETAELAKKQSRRSKKNNN